MSKWLIITTLFLSLMLPLKVLSQEEDSKPDHLQPVNGILDSYDFEVEYYSKVRKILFKGLSDTPEIQFVEMPSFSPENVLTIEHDVSLEKYFLIYHLCKTSIWYAEENWETVEIEKYKIEIDKKSVDLIKNLFKKAIMKVKFHDNNGSMGLDGTTYYFTVNDFGLKTGTVWSPDENSKMDKLVQISYALIQLAKDGKSIVSLSTELSSRIEKLTHDIN